MRFELNAGVASRLNTCSVNVLHTLSSLLNVGRQICESCDSHTSITHLILDASLAPRLY